MPHMKLTISANEQPEPAIAKATPLGLIATEAIVHVGAAEIRGSALALRRVGEAALRAADMADDYDRDPAAWERRERGRRG